MKRTLENCRLVREFGKPKQYFGVCEGLQSFEMDDEPCNVCKKCKLSDFGVPIFMSLEEAEQALKENRNDN